MRDRHHTIDIGVVFALKQRILGDHRNLLRFGARAHARRYYQDVVARAHAAIGASKATKGHAFIRRYVNGRRRVEVLRQIAHNRYGVRHVSVRDRIAFANPERCANRLAILQHELARGNCSRSETMARLDAIGYADQAAIRQLQSCTGQNRIFHHRDIILRANDDSILTDNRHNALNLS